LRPSYWVEADAEFDAHHRRDAAGAVVDSHAHRWRVAVRATSQELDRIAIVVDFRKLRQQTDELLDRLRGKTLEDTPELDGTDATPLAVAEWLLLRLREQAVGQTYRIARVTVGCDPRIEFTVGDEAD
jgi:6-pyruvoyl-tetrahydropterin synthase